MVNQIEFHPGQMQAQTVRYCQENARVFDFEISAGDMAAIDAMPYCGGSGLHPDEVDF